MARNYKLKSKLFGLGLATLAPFSMLSAGVIFSNQASLADSTLTQTEWTDPNVGDDLITSNSFNISGTSQDGNTLASTWKAIDYDAFSVGMIIDVGSSFNNNKTRYFLDDNPGKLSDKIKEDKILMINSKYSETSTPRSAKRGYRSNEFTLKSNSYYKLSVNAKTTTNNTSGINEAYGSIYLSGLKDEKDKEVELSYTGITGAWTTYNFFLATGNEDQNVTLDLYLGKSNTEGSYGAVFYDEVKVEQYSQNAFIADCVQRGYTFQDNYESNAKIYNKFMVDRFVPLGSSLMQDQEYKYYDYNFDFEKEIGNNGLTNEWFIPANLNSPNAHAIIFDVVNGKEYFENTTKYKFVGNDFSYNMKEQKPNTQALALYTDKGFSSNITLQNTKNIEIRAHGVYKISMKVKFSEMSGAFYVNLVDEEGKILGSTSGLSTNSTNKATNDYTDVVFYVKGKALADTNINLQLALGNESSQASGCVMVDNIKIEYASSSDAEGADNYLNLEGDEVSLDFKNAYFNYTAVEDGEFTFPLTAKYWTATKPTDKTELTESGVIYLNNDQTYDKLYSKYSWASSYPGNPIQGSIDAPNNVYMLHNGNYSYQSIKSEPYTLEADKYYNLTFDYYTLDVDPAKDTQITVEVVDDNKIVLFKETLASTHNTWSSKNGNPINIDFHTALTSSHNINVIIHLGTEDDKMIGTAYLDNFAITSIDKDKFDKSTNQVDLTDYMLNLDPNGEIGSSLSTSPAYTFNVDNGSSNAMVGGIVKGQNNEFGVEYEDGNLLVLASRLSPATGSLKSNYTFKLNSGSYYKLTFTLKTNLNERPDADHEDDEKNHECKYGVKVGLTNFTLAEEIKSNEEFTDYTIYFYASTEATSNLQFSLALDKHTEGSAYLSNINFTNSSEEAYNDAKSDDNKEYNKTVFTSTYVSNDNSDTNPPTDETPDNVGDVNNMNWILIPSIITSMAVIIAVVGWLLRQVKIKKIEKIREESYDRKISLNQELIIGQAVKERDREIEKTKENIKEMQSQKQLLEEDHKQMIKDARLSSKGKITKETEKEFKSYASKLSRLQQKIDILNEQLTKIQSPEYLIAIERRIASEETKRQREAIKQKDAKQNDLDKQ